MNIKFAHPVVFVKDIEISKKFYSEILGIPIMYDWKICVLFKGDFAIHQAEEILLTLKFEKITQGNILQGKNNLIIYFESQNPDEDYRILLERGVHMIHPVEKQAWGQRVFRFYDPDGYIVEIGEPSYFSSLFNK